jgi:hypothetical protein
VNDRSYADVPAPRRRRAPARHDSTEQDARWSPLLGLQQSAGNSAVSNHVQRDVEPGKDDENLPPTIQHPAQAESERSHYCFDPSQQELLVTYAEAANGVQAGLEERPPDYAGLVKTLQIITSAISEIGGDQPGQSIMTNANNTLRSTLRALGSYLVAPRDAFDAAADDLIGVADATLDLSEHKRTKPAEGDVDDGSSPLDVVPTAPTDDPSVLPLLPERPLAGDPDLDLDALDPGTVEALHNGAGNMRAAAAELRKAAPNLAFVREQIEHAVTTLNQVGGGERTTWGSRIRRLNDSAMFAAAPAWVHTTQVGSLLAAMAGAVGGAATELREASTAGRAERRATPPAPTSPT